MTDDTTPQSQATDNSGPQFAVHRVYLKDVSFETPNSPAVFQNEQNPEISLQLNSEVNTLGEDLYEVVMTLTVTAKHEEETAFLVEVQQAGIFTVKGFDQAQAGEMLGAYCPNTLYPFAREVVASLVTKGSFPQLLLAPINFDMLHQEQVSKVQQQMANQETMQ